MTDKEKFAGKIIGDIKEESIKKFNCLNYQFISAKLEEALIKHVDFKIIKKTKIDKIHTEIRNLDILSEVIFGKRYKDLRLKYKITSTAGIQIICKRTAQKLSQEIKSEMNLIPPKRVINMYSAHLLDLIKTRKNILEGKLNETNK